MTRVTLLSTASSDVARGVHLYFSGACTIVAPLHRNLAGIYYEQSKPIVLNGDVSSASLGVAFREAFDLFSNFVTYSISLNDLDKAK